MPTMINHIDFLLKTGKQTQSRANNLEVSQSGLRQARSEVILATSIFMQFYIYMLAIYSQRNQNKINERQSNPASNMFRHVIRCSSMSEEDQQTWSWLQSEANLQTPDQA